MSTRVRGHLRTWNTAVGLLSLPVLVVSAATGIALFAVLSGLVSGFGPMALLAVHVYSGLVGLPLAVAKTATGLLSWRARPGRRTTDRRTGMTWADLSSLLLVVSVLSLYTSGTLLHLNLTPGGNAGYKTVHLWSAVAAAPFVTHNLVRHLRPACLGARRRVTTADGGTLAVVRRCVFQLGGAGVLGWAVTRLAGRAGQTAVSAGPNDFPVTIAASGSDQPDPRTWCPGGVPRLDHVAGPGDRPHHPTGRNGALRGLWGRSGHHAGADVQHTAVLRRAAGRARTPAGVPAAGDVVAVGVRMTEHHAVHRGAAR